MVECFPCKDFRKVCFNFLFVMDIFNILPDIFYHLHYFNVGAAVLRPLQRRHCRRNGRICVGTGRSDYPCGKCGVISAAMFHMQQQRNIQHFRFQRTIFLVRPQHHQQVFRRRKLWFRTVYVHTVVIFIMVIGMVTVHRKHRENTNQFNALPQAIADNIRRIDLAVIRRQRQDAPCHGIHNILCGGFHNYVPCKIRRKGPAVCHDFTKFL